MAELGFAYAVSRTQRKKTLSLVVSAEEVKVLAPRHVSHQEIHDFVLRKRNWVISKLEREKERARLARPKTYQQGEVFDYLGKRYYLAVDHAESTGVSLNNDRLCVTLAQPVTLQQQATLVQSALYEWYRERAQETLTRLSHEMGAVLGVQPKAIKLKVTKTKWGHCTSNGEIQYNWFIICAPMPIIRYLVAHEMCHLVHLNHSPAYWQLVARLCPDYKHHKAWLKNSGFMLYL